ncbi:MAG: serine hydrolase [Pseudomonadota bacterium]
MTVMQGFPPEEADRAALGNWRTSPYCRWAFHHVREIVPSADIPNDPSDVWALERGEADLSAAGLDDAVGGMSNDALVIVKSGRIVHESYRNGMGPGDPHILMSVSKSMLGLLGGVLVEAGELDPDAPLTSYLPEIAGTAYAGATVRQALDMRVGARFDEDYFTTSGPIIDYRYAANWNPAPQGYEPTDLRGFQSRMVESDGPHGGRFHYVSPVTDLLAWVYERATGRRYADLMSERLWKPMGAETPAYITVDRIGGPRAAGGMCVTARDLARVGLLMLCGGMRDGRRVIPAGWIDDIVSGGDPEAWARGDFADKFPGVDRHYRSKWYVHRGETPLIHGLGIHGQYLFVDPAREISIAWLSSEHEPISDVWGAHVLGAVARIREALS